MKLSTNTVNVLKNFSVINEGIFIKKGNVIETISKQKNILARAELSDNFDQEFGIYDLNNFLGVLSLQKDSTELEFDDKNILIKAFAGKSQIKYRKAAKEMILVPPDKKVNMTNPEISFTLSAEEIAWVTRVANQLSSPNIAFVSDGTKVEIQSYDAKDDSAHVNTTEIGTNSTGKNYRMIFATENLKFIEGSYDVKISAKGVAHFKNTVTPVEYWVMAESGSKYEG
jgi:hypothetical protein